MTTAMLHALPNDTVALPGIAAMMLGFLAFFIALMAARHRATRIGTEPVSQRASITWLWILVQGLGIGIAGFGPVHVGLDPMSAKALIEAAIVLVLMLGAVWLFDASSRAMGKNWALVARTLSDHTLVQTGPFAVVRNPIYIALFGFMIAIAIAFGHTRNLFVAVPLYALGTWMRVAHEERLLRTQFGAAYDNYAARVKRFVPGVL